jgi:hypothetical protein
MSVWDAASYLTPFDAHLMCNAVFPFCDLRAYPHICTSTTAYKRKIAIQAMSCEISSNMEVFHFIYRFSTCNHIIKFFMLTTSLSYGITHHSDVAIKSHAFTHEMKLCFLHKKNIHSERKTMQIQLSS